MNNELRQLAALAVRNAFYLELSAVMNAFLKASEGLGAAQETQLGEMTSIYGRDMKAESDVFLNIWTQNGGCMPGHETIKEALGDEDATEVHLCGKKVFERVDGEWRFLSE